MDVFPVQAYLLGYLVTAALAIGVDVWVRRHGRGSAATWFRLPLYGTAMWALGSALQLSVAGEATKTVVMQLWTVAAWSVPLGWFVFVLHYTGSTHLLTREVKAGLVGLYAILTGLTLTNQYHGLVWSDIRLVTDVYAVPVLVVERTSVYWAGLTIEYLLGGITVLLLAKLLLTARRVGRYQVAALVAGIVLPIVLNTVSVATDQYVPALNLTPVGAGVLLVFVGYALFRYQLFGIEPLARAEVLEVIDEGVVIVDETGRIVDFNDRATSLFPDLDGAFGESLAATAPALLEDPSSSPDFVDSLVVETDAGERSISVSVSELAVTADSRAEVVVCQDVTELDAYARELEQRTEQLDRFAETVSHDLRNPLSVLQGRLELIQETGDPSHAEAAADAANRMNTIIDDVLTLARQGHALGETEPVGLATVATEAWATTDTGDAELRLDATEEDTIVADAARLRTALENLYRNAIEHGVPEESTSAADSGDGTVTRSTRSTGRESTDEAPLTVTVGTTADGFYVADDGAGIPAEDRDTLFEYGYTTASDGTGFGLAIVDEVAQAHGWSVEVESSASGGARFTFSGVAEKND